MSRAGWLTRRTAVVPHGKMQSVRVTQGPLQRRLDLATVHLDTPIGPVNAVALHRSSAVARELAEAQPERSRLARRLAGPERWMQLPAVSVPDPAPARDHAPGRADHDHAESQDA